MFGDTAANFLVVISASQFPLPFYLSRTLPNVFALAVCLRALHHWLEEGQRYTEIQSLSDIVTFTL